MIASAALRPFLPYIAGGVLVALIGTHWWAYSKGVHVERQRWQIVQAKEWKARAAQEAANRQEEQRRFAAQKEITDEAIRERDKARADADDARAAGVRLRTKIRDLTLSVALRDPASPGDGAAAGETIAMLGRVQQRLDEAADGLARYADDAATAGRACERSYDALTR